jgi:pimeloyl-ACP methyl ester carboxylesterase
MHLITRRRRATPPSPRLRLLLAAVAAVAALVLATQAPMVGAADGDGGGAGAGGGGPKPTVVLVHGAFADASGFEQTIHDLLDQGYPVIAPANPLRGLSSDSAYIASVLATIEGPIVLVGHSYGGAVITNAASGNPNVEALVYLGAYAPDAGETVLQLTGRFPGSLIPEAIRPRPYPLGDGSEGVDLYIAPEAFREVFAADVPEATTAVMAASQRPASQVAFGEPTGPDPAWTTIPSWWLLTTADNAIPPAAQRFMAERAGSHVYEVDSSHAVMVSNPAYVTTLITIAADATS